MIVVSRLNYLHKLESWPADEKSNSKVTNLSNVPKGKDVASSLSSMK